MASGNSDDDIMRTVIQLTDEQIAALRALCERRGISRAEAIRQAVDRLVEDEARKKTSRDEVLEATFGAWKHRGIDTDTYLEEIRSEWDRQP